MNSKHKLPTKNKKIIVFASGEGTNAENIINYFEPHNTINVSHLFSNNPNAGALQRAYMHENITVGHFDRQSFYDTDEMLDLLKDIQPSLIVLAGFLWKFPEKIIDAFPNRIINIHPALLPKYGGKGMYGDHVHRAVLENNESESGITVHYVTKDYDEGKIIFQLKTKVEDNETVRSLRDKIHVMEYKNFPQVIEKLLSE